MLTGVERRVTVRIFDIDVSIVVVIDPVVALNGGGAGFFTVDTIRVIRIHIAVVVVVK